MYFMKNFVVAIKCDGKVLREDKNVVFLPFNKEYSILLKNLFSRKASVGVEIDGEDVLNGRRLIIDANSEVELERYLKDPNKGNKFKFIPFTKDIEQYRGRKICDGIVRVSFRFEKEYEPLQWSYTWSNFQPYNTTTYYCNSISSTPTSIEINGVNKDSDSKVLCSNSSNIEVKNKCDVAVADNFSAEGITVPGSISEQKFQYGYIDTLENEEHVITLQLKGTKENCEIKTPLTTKTKLICVTCGKLNRSNNKFCYNCGTSLKII